MIKILNVILIQQKQNILNAIDTLSNLIQNLIVPSPTPTNNVSQQLKMFEELLLEKMCPSFYSLFYVLELLQ